MDSRFLVVSGISTRRSGDGEAEMNPERHRPNACESASWRLRPSQTCST